MVKNPPTSAGDSGDMGSTPGSKRSSVGGKGNPLQYSCLENSTDRGTWWATDQEVAESDMTEHMRARAHTHTHTHTRTHTRNENSQPRPKFISGLKKPVRELFFYLN